VDQNYIAPASALKKLKKARNLSQTVYLYGATGYGKTELVRQYLSGRRYTYLSCEELPWEDGALPRLEPGRQKCRVVVIDDLHRLKSEELRREIIALEERADIWLILISRSPVPTWLMPQHIKSVFVVISEKDLRMGRSEIAAYLESRGIAYTEEDMRLLEVTAEGNAYILHHVALRMKEGLSPGSELHAEIWDAFAAYLENVVLVRWDSDLLEFLMQVSVVDEFTLELAEMISGNLHVAALLEQAAEAGNFIFQEDGTYRLRPVLIDALRNRTLKVYGTERVKDLKYNAALYYEMHDEVVPALRLFEVCGKTERIKSLLIRNARMNVGIGHYYELRHYYFNLDEQEIADSPVLMAGMSMLYSLLMDGEKSEYWYEKLKAYTANARGGVRREAQSRLAYLDVCLPHRNSTDLLETFERLPALQEKGMTLPEVSLTDNLPSILNGAKDFCWMTKQTQNILTSHSQLIEQVLGLAAKGLIDATLGETIYEKGGDTYEILRLLSRSRLESDRGHSLMLAFVTIGLRVRLNLLYGDVQAALDILKPFEQQVREQGATHLLPNIRALYCRIALYTGDKAVINRWLTEAPTESKEFNTLERYRYLTKVRCYISCGNYLQAQALLETLRYYAEQYHRPYIQMEVGLLSAIIKERLDGDWLGELLPTLRQISSFGFIRLVSEEGAAINPLLQAARKECAADPQINQDWLRTLLAETAAVAVRYPVYLKKQLAEVPDFSPTALTILRLQSDGLSVNKIAEQMGMKAVTVKYHTRENYRKLGVAGKTDAVLAARNLGIL